MTLIPSQAWLNDWLPLILLATTAFMGLITWTLNEWSKRSDKDYLRKEKRYLELIESLEGDHNTDELKNNFRHQINLCWLHCPDDVIRKGNNLLSKLNDRRCSTEQKEIAFSEFMLTIRKDTLKKPWHRLWVTKLNPADFRTWKTIKNYDIMFKRPDGGTTTIKIGHHKAKPPEKTQ